MQRRQPYLFRILRYQPDRIDPPQQQIFEVTLESDKSVLDGLELIRLTRDDTLMYRHCCHHASCGTCACTINGMPALTCTTHMSDFDGDTIELAPLANLRCIGDLVVDMREFFEEFDVDWSNLKAIQSVSARQNPVGVDQVTQLENCIECASCIAACPVMPETHGFMGPAALAALNTELSKTPAQRKTLLKLAVGKRGAKRCRRHLACSRVCPSKVYPARHIADLQRAIGKR